MDVRLPNLGEGADSGTVVNLLVKEGDDVSRDQNLIEVETGKAVVAVPSPTAGKVGNFKVKAGDKISVGQVIVSIGDGAAGADAQAGPEPEKSAKPDRAKPVAAPVEKEALDGGEDEAAVVEEEPRKSPFPPPASPTIRKLARDLGIDLARVKGSEHGGRIVLDDLRSYIQRLQKLAFGAPKGTPKQATPASQVDFSKWGPITRQPMTSLRKTISHRMVESWTTVPQVTQFDEADISAIMELRKKHKAEYEAKGAHLTLTVFVLKALVDTLKKHPNFNSSIEEVSGEIILKQYFHIGIAVDTEAGLIVPVIRDADKKSMLQLARELGELGEKTRDRKVKMEDLVGGTFTVSNQGGIGGAHFTPIVNKPEVAILGLGRGIVKPVVKNGKIEPATMLPICLSYDHRVIDGGAAARFTKDLLASLEAFKDVE